MESVLLVYEEFKMSQLEDLKDYPQDTAWYHMKMKPETP